MNITAYQLAERFIGMKEAPGSPSNPAVLAMLRLDESWPAGDDVAWCSAFVNYIAWLLRLPRSKSLRARSWLQVGQPISMVDARPGFDVVILNRGGPSSPLVIEAPGHVGFFAGVVDRQVHILGGNQGDVVNVSAFPASSLLGVRRLNSSALF
jgi:uncharacterized protein (TIGR02594 family)